MMGALSSWTVGVPMTKDADQEEWSIYSCSCCTTRLGRYNNIERVGGLRDRWCETMNVCNPVAL